MLYYYAIASEFIDFVLQMVANAGIAKLGYLVDSVFCVDW